VLLLKEHHAVQGVLQSEEFGHPCIYGWENPHLDDEIALVWKKWMVIKAKPGLTVRHAKGWTEESKQKVRQSMMGKNNPMYGRTHSDDVRKIISEKAKGRKMSEEIKERHRKTFSGEGNPMYGRSGKQAPAYGKRWGVNKEGHAVLALEQPGSDWKLGRRWR
jgi:hypothetical protein